MTDSTKPLEEEPKQKQLEIEPEVDSILDIEGSVSLDYPAYVEADLSIEEEPEEETINYLG